MGKYEYINYPDPAAPLLAFHDHRYEEAVIGLNPFFRMPQVLTRNEELDLAYDPGADNGETVLQLLAFGTPETWASVGAGVGFTSPRDMGQALTTSPLSTGIGPRRHANCIALAKYCDDLGLREPGEGWISSLAFPALARLFQSYGIDTLLMQGELVGEELVEPLPDPSDLRRLAACFHCYSTPRVASPDAQLVVTVDWDSYFYLVFGPRGVGERCLQLGLEGFLAGPRTTHDWAFDGS